MTDEEIFNEYLIRNFGIDTMQDVLSDYLPLKDSPEFKQYLLQKRLEPMMEVLNNVVRDAIDKIQRVCSKLEPYQWYEMLHPRKKPRGSIRRNKRRKKNG